jgi:plasmid maintenance system antidote protein VapI
MEIKEIVHRIENVMAHYDLSPATFADTIGVQRSSISHLLKGRNKPSLDFILKVKTAFPEININWLIFGQGNLVDDEHQEKEKTMSPPSPTKRLDAVALNEKEIDRIVIFYTDGTFKSHKEA